MRVVQGKCADLHHDETLIITDGDLIPRFAKCNTPCPLQGIAERVLQTVRSTVPELDRAILATADDEREVRVKDGEENVVRVAFERLHATLAEVVPDLHGLVVAGGNKVWLVRAGVELNVVNALVVRIHGEVGRRGAK